MPNSDSPAAAPWVKAVNVVEMWVFTSDAAVDAQMRHRKLNVSPPMATMRLM